MNVDSALMLEISREVWSTVLSMDLEESEHPEPDLQFGVGYFVGSVQITGERDLVVTISLPRALALKAAAAMLEMDPTEVVDELITDALGEITNMVAGSLKNRVAGGCRLSVPTVIQGDHIVFCLPGSHLLLDLALTSAMLPLTIAVRERLVHRSLI